MAEPGQRPKSAVSIEVTAQKVGEDPEINIFHVAVTHDQGVWTETFGCPEQLHAFLRGIKAGASMYAGVRVPDPELPWETRH